MPLIVFVGHCGPDSSYLRMAVTSVDSSARFISADDESSLRRAMADGADLILFNRLLSYGFAEQEGVDLIKRLKLEFPRQKMMLVSNYPEAQEAAVAAGALPGFGKAEIGTRRASDRIRAALLGVENG